MKKATNQDTLKALRIAEIKATDKEDFNNCVSDLVKTASLDTDEAKIIANAIRSKFLPNILREAGFEDDEIKDHVNLDSEAEQTADFANDFSNDDEEDMLDDEDDQEDDDFEDLNMDEDEVEDDEETATFEIEVPADMVDAAKQAVQEALDNLLGGEDADMDSDMDDGDDMDSDMESDEDLDMEDDMEDDSEEDEFMEEDDMEDDSDMEDDMEDDEDMEEDSEPEMHKTSKVNNMTKQALAARRAEREDILRRLAAEEEHVQASASFKYNNEMANMPGEVDYPTMKLQGENSMKGENPSWSDQKVPTKNPGSLQFPDVTKPSNFEGAGDGSLEYTVDWDSLENPSEGSEYDMFEVPTEMPVMPSKTTVANSKTASYAMEDEEKHAVQCSTCGYKTMMTQKEMDNPDTDCEKCSMNDKEDHDVDSAVNIKPDGNITVSSSSLDLERARIKTAYSCSNKLALAGIIEASEVDAYSEQMLNDNLKADAMVRQTKLLLKSAQASSERVAAAAADRMTRTASSNGISTSPAFSGSSITNNAALDIQAALKGTWSMPQIED